MNKTIRTGLFFLLTVIVYMKLLAPSAFATDPGLERVHANSESTWYISAKTVANPVAEGAGFWSTVVPNKNGALYDVLGMVLNKRGKNAGQLEYIQIQQEANCPMGNVTSSSVRFYDKQDRIIHTVNSPDSAQLIAEFGQAENSLIITLCGSQLAQATEQ
jgi:hypothetical protein